MLAKLHFESMILFLVLFIGSALAEEGKVAKPKVPAAGKVVSLYGDVSLLPAATSALPSSARALHPGDELKPGDQIQTGSPGSVKLLLTDRSIIDLGPSSKFKLNQYELKNGENRNVEMSLSQGRLRNSVQTPVKKPGRFIIRTGAAIMGVRGTEFIVSAVPTDRELKTQVTVIHGTVEYTPQAGASGSMGPPIQLNEGRQLTAVNPVSAEGRVLASANSAPPTVTHLQNNEVQTAAHEGRVADTTFHQAVVVENNQGPPGPAGSTLIAMEQSFAPPRPPPPPSFGAMGAPGTGVGFAPPGTRPPIGNPINVKVVFRR